MSEQRVTTRIAPTPSGYLHLGNAVNFVVVAEFARAHHGRLFLRIDDFDRDRARQEYRDDIANVLSWLEIRPETTLIPDHTQEYRAALAALPTFNCRCSRTSNRVCECADRGYPLVPFESAAKLAVSGEHIVVWRRDDLPAYHLVNVVEDARAQITHVIRGEDLRESSAIHTALAQMLGIAPPTYLHHELLTDAHGRKLSKSTLRAAHPITRDDATLAEVRARASAMRLS